MSRSATFAERLSYHGEEGDRLRARVRAADAAGDERGALRARRDLLRWALRHHLRRGTLREVLALMERADHFAAGLDRETLDGLLCVFDPPHPHHLEEEAA